MILYTVKIFKIINEYYEQLYADMFEKLKEMDNFWEKKLPKSTQGELNG